MGAVAARDPGLTITVSAERPGPERGYAPPIDLAAAGIHESQSESPQAREEISRVRTRTALYPVGYRFLMEKPEGPGVYYYNPTASVEITDSGLSWIDGRPYVLAALLQATAFEEEAVGVKTCLPEGVPVCVVQGGEVRHPNRSPIRFDGVPVTYDKKLQVLDLSEVNEVPEGNIVPMVKKPALAA